MKKFLFGIHCHQPVDNFHNVVDLAIQKSYAPFIRVAKQFPEFKFSLHISGWLLNYIKENAKELFRDLKELSLNNQIEFFAGGYYEPILASIPSSDRVGQINMLSNFIEKEFGKRPTGLWLTERVWESAIIPDLAKCGIKYVVVDDYHFWASGVDNTSGYYNTEESGEKIALFPIHKNLRYAMPFTNHGECVDIICKEQGAAIMFDDGEKFGLWPNTYEWVYENNWLFNFLSDAKEKLEFSHFSDFYNTQKPLGVIYPPSCSYYEMGEWSLKTDDALLMHELKTVALNIANESQLAKSLRGGTWKNFLVKYPEAGHIHKRMLEMSNLAKVCTSDEFKESLYKLQTNDCLWHGVFGGLYLPNLRDNAYSYLIECESLAYKTKDVKLYDYNMDGLIEAKLQNDNFIAIFDSSYGGSMSEFCVKNLKFNYQNTLARRKEAYHEKLVAIEENGNHSQEIGTIHKDTIFVSQELIDSLVFENYPRCSFMDYFSATEMVEINVAKPVETRVEWEQCEEMGIKTSYKNERGDVSKKFVLEDDGLKFNIDVENSNVRHYSCVLNIHLANYKECKFNGLELKERIFKIGQTSLTIEDGVFNSSFVIELDMPSNIIIIPINTASQSEDGIELTNQAVSIIFGMPIYTNGLKFSGKIKVF